MEPAASVKMVGDWIVGERIGSGSFAVVWKAYHKDTKEPVAVKEIDTEKLNKKLMQSLESEVSILKRITHKNIVKLYQVIEEKNRIFLVMEYCSGGDLAQYIRRSRRLPEIAARTLMQQLAAGLKELWSHHMVHRDLKPQNLLLSTNRPGAVLKIADFGFARNLQPQGLAETLCGSPLYMAPEILQYHKYDAKADLWSVGTILFELVTGKPPFNGMNHVQLLKMIQTHEARIPAGIEANLSESCVELVYKLLRRNPVERISFEEFFSHAFLSGAPSPSSSHTSPTNSASEVSTASRSSTPPGWTPAERPRSLAPPPMPAPLFAADGPAPMVGASPDDMPFLLREASAGDVQAMLAGPQRGPLDPIPEPEALRPAPLLQARYVQMQPNLRGSGPPQPCTDGSTFSTPSPFPSSSTHSSNTTTTPGSRPAPQQPAFTGAPGPAPLSGTSTPAADSSSAALDDDDDDYVLISAPSPSSSGQATRPQPGSLGSLSSRSGAGVGSGLAGGGAAATGAAAAAGGQHPRAAVTPHPLGSQPGLHPDDASQPTAMEVVIPGRSPMGAPRPPAAPAPPQFAPALGRLESLQRVAHMLDGLAAGRGKLEALALRLLALQVLAYSLELAIMEQESALMAGPAIKPQTSEAPSPAQRVALLSGLMRDVSQRAEADMSGDGGMQPEAEQQLPDVWELVYRSSLDLLRAAAADEVLGSYRSSMHVYAKAGALLYFMFAEAPGLPLDPPLQLSGADQARLQKYAAAISSRHQACEEALQAAAPPQDLDPAALVAGSAPMC